MWRRDEGHEQQWKMILTVLGHPADRQSTLHDMADVGDGKRVIKVIRLFAWVTLGQCNVRLHCPSHVTAIML